MDSRSAVLPTMSKRRSANMLCSPARISGDVATMKTRITRRCGPFRCAELPAARSRAGRASNRREEIRNATGEGLVHRWPSQDRQWIENVFPLCPAKCAQPSAKLARLDFPARLPAKPVRTCGRLHEASAQDEA